MKRLGLAPLALVLMSGAAEAQSTATPVQPGYLATSGCPSVNLTPCFIPYGSAIPVTPGGGQTITDRSTTATTTSQTLMVANTSRSSLSIQNLTASGNVCYSFATPAVCGATGSYTVAAGAMFYWPAGSAPKGALYVIASTGSPPVSAYEGQ